MRQLGVREILCEQVDEAVEAVSGKRVTAKEIHAARKSLKKARATLRLMRPAISDVAYRRENAALRDAARPLSAARDAHVLIDSLARLEKLYGRAARDSAPPAFRRSLARDETSVRRSIGRPTQSRSLATIRNRIGRMRLSGEGWSELGEGLQRIYGGGRDAMKQAIATPTPECFHEWRKQVKYLWHQLQLLEPIWPGPIGELGDQLHQLSDYLGDDHDLAVLREKVTARPKCFPQPEGSGALLALIDRCQDRLRARALRSGERIYSEKPAAFSGRLGKYWKQWQTQD